SEPAYCLVLNPEPWPSPVRGFSIFAPMLLMFATQIPFRRASKAIAPGNQPTGIRPSNFDAPGLNWKTATAFCVPLQTKSVLPDLSNASALGCAPNKSAGFCRAQIVSTILSVRVSMTLNVSLPAFATTRNFPFGDNAIAQACRPVKSSEFRVLGSAFEFKLMIETEPSLAMERSSTRTRVPRPAGPVTLLA